MANDHCVIRDFDRRRRQLTDGDFAFRHLHLAGNRQLVVLHRNFQVWCHFQHRIGLDRDRQLRAFEAQINHQHFAPGYISIQCALPGFAAFPATVQLHAFTDDQRLNLQRLETGGQFRPGDFAIAKGQAAIDLGRE